MYEVEQNNRQETDSILSENIGAEQVNNQRDESCAIIEHKIPLTKPPTLQRKLLVNFKIPADVQNTDKLQSMLGGPAFITRTLLDIDTQTTSFLTQQQLSRQNQQ